MLHGHWLGAPEAAFSKTCAEVCRMSTIHRKCHFETKSAYKHGPQNDSIMKKMAI